MNTFRVLLSRVIAPVIASLAAWLLVKFGVVLDADTQAKLTEAGSIVILAVWGIVYGVVHKIIDHKANPGDAASGALAEKQKFEASRFNATR